MSELIEAWITAHIPDDAATDFDRGRRALALELLAELAGSESVG